MRGGPGRGDERACTSGRADSAPNLADSASVASAVAIVASAFAASDFAALAAPSCSLAGSGSGFTSSAAAFAAFNALASLAATVTASASRRLSSFSEALALALTFALAAATCFALACSFAAAAILVARVAASEDTAFLAVSADFATASTVLRPFCPTIRGQRWHDFEGGSRVCAPRRRQAAGTQELRHDVIGAQAVYKRVGVTRACSHRTSAPFLRAAPSPRATSCLACAGDGNGRKLVGGELCGLWVGARLRVKRCGISLTLSDTVSALVLVCWGAWRCACVGAIWTPLIESAPILLLPFLSWWSRVHNSHFLPCTEHTRLFAGGGGQRRRLLLLSSMARPLLDPPQLCGWRNRDNWALECSRSDHLQRVVVQLGRPVDDVARLLARGRAEAVDAVVLVAAGAGRLPHPDRLAAEQRPDSQHQLVAHRVVGHKVGCPRVQIHAGRCPHPTLECLAVKIVVAVRDGGGGDSLAQLAHRSITLVAAPGIAIVAD
eukprot:scaffold60011_cov53-Phaeocystis_antarctica.AAC.2